MKLWYLKSANPDDWNEALPIGNGALGGMVFGGVKNEHIQLNEDSLWYGGSRDRNNPDSLKYLPEIRSKLFEGRIKEAERLSYLAQFGVGEQQRHYESLGDIYINFNEHDGEMKNYKRELDIEQAIVNISYNINGINYKREIFTSAVHNVMVIRITADKVNSVSLDFNLDRYMFNNKMGVISQDTAFVSGGSGSGDGIEFTLMAKSLAKGGNTYSLGNTIIVEKANEAIILITARTSYRNKNHEEWCGNTLNKVCGIEYEKIKFEHIQDYQYYYKRVNIELKGTNEDELEKLPTDIRLNNIKNGQDDMGLISLYFQFGRYLLISCSRPGTLPANLQGIWNKDMMPPWGGKFTININTEMNYWLAETCNLSECHEALFEHIEKMRFSGRITAKKMYNCSGFVAHHNTDIWGDTAPQDKYTPATIWPMGAAWLCLHLWEHYKFTENKEFLIKYYETLKESAQFFVDFLIRDLKGRLVTCPSVSPENTYILPSGESGCLCIGPSMDSQIINDLFTSCIEASQILDRDKDFGNRLKEMRELLPKPEIGKYAQIKEWAEDYDEAEPGHRHISQLFALYPSNQITIRRTPQLAKAARATLERRLSYGGGHTGWSRAWIINMWARLEDGELAYQNLKALLSNSTQLNLFDSHPPFQIDGNFGGTAGIVEMLVQSHDKEINLLPALPKVWRDGNISGICCRGGFEIDINWKDNKLFKATIKSKLGNKCRLRTTRTIKVFLNDEIIEVKYYDDGLVVEFETEIGRSYSIV